MLLNLKRKSKLKLKIKKKNKHTDFIKFNLDKFYFEKIRNKIFKIKNKIHNKSKRKFYKSRLQLL